MTPSAPWIRYCSQKPPGQAALGRPPRADPPERILPSPGNTATVSMHPTGMLSYFCIACIVKSKIISIISSSED